MEVVAFTTAGKNAIVQIQCPYCKSKHIHGGHGYRAAHCGKGEYKIILLSKSAI